MRGKAGVPDAFVGCNLTVRKACGYPLTRASEARQNEERSEKQRQLPRKDKGTEEE